MGESMFSEGLDCDEWGMEIKLGTGNVDLNGIMKDTEGLVSGIFSSEETLIEGGKDE